MTGDVQPTGDTHGPEDIHSPTDVRQRRTDHTRKLVEGIKKNMHDAETENRHGNIWLKTGIALGISAGLFLVYKFFF